MARLIQFMHPGGEPLLPASGDRPWNDGMHVRCFLQAFGAAIRVVGSDATIATTNEYVFWGEWEGPARIERIQGNDQRLPTMRVFPKPAQCPNSGQPQNTDPFVFGKTFLYSCCKQVRRDGQPTYLRDLDRGDVILFGSRHQKRFVLDTVFVVRDSRLYDPRNAVRDLAGFVTDAFVEATLRPLELWHDSGRFRAGAEAAVTSSEGEWTEDDERTAVGSCGSRRALKYRLYWGATPEQPVSGMFSFVPTMAFAEAPHGFARPTLDLPFIKPGMSTGFRNCLEGEHADLVIEEAWRQIAEVVLSRDVLDLGVHFELPRLQG